MNNIIHMYSWIISCYNNFSYNNGEVEIYCISVGVPVWESGRWTLGVPSPADSHLSFIMYICLYKLMSRMA